MNIIMLVIDTLRYDYIGANGNPWIRTPNMDSLAARSWVFDRAFQSSFPTIPHRREVLTGRYGGPFHPWRPLPHDMRTLPEALAEKGYCTQLIHDTPHLVNGGHNFDWPFHGWTFVRGAEVDRPWLDSQYDLPENWRPDPLFAFADWQQIYKDRTSVTYARANRKRHDYADWNAAKLFLTAADWLRDNATRDNFFLWIDCFDPHEPWDVPAEYARMYVDDSDYDGRIDPREFIFRNSPEMSQEARARVAAHYAGKVSWVDRWIGEVTRALDETDLWKDTAVVLTADHGTNVGERGRFGKGVPVRQQEAHVPLFICAPGAGTGRSTVLAQPHDIHATVLSLADLDGEKSDGHDLLAQARGAGDPARAVTISGPSVDSWARILDDHGDSATLFTVFDQEWCLEYALRQEDCKLIAMDSLEDLSDEHPHMVDRLRSLGRDEIVRRDLDPALQRWLEGEGTQPLPEECRFWHGWPGPKGFSPYFTRLYTEWERPAVEPRA